MSQLTLVACGLLLGGVGPRAAAGMPVGHVVSVPGEIMALDSELSAAAVSGLVVDAQTGAPVKDAWLTLMPRRRSADGKVIIGRPADRRSTTSGADGRFQIEADAGDYQLWVSAGGYLEQTLEVTAARAIRVALVRGLVLAGRVVDQSGRGVPELWVRATPKAGDGYSERTDGEGRFRMDQLSDGPVDLFARRADGPGFAFRPEVTPGQLDLVLSLRPGGRLRLRVLGPDGPPVASARAYLLSVDGSNVLSGLHRTPEAKAGLIEMHVPAGTVSVEVSSGRLRGVIEVVVAEGESIDRDVRLKDNGTAGSPDRQP